MALKEGYIEVSERVAQFRSNNPKGTIETEVETVLHDLGEDGKILLNTVKATIRDGEGKILGTGHSQGEAGDEKNLEKTETVAVGRALVNAGYKAVDETSEEEVQKEVKEARKESRFSKSSDKPKSRFQKAEKEEAAEEEASEEEEESTETAAEEEKAAAPKETPKASTSKVSDLLAKYGKKGGGSSLSNMRR